MRGNCGRTALACEPLEGRDCPAGQIGVFFGVMTVVGDAGANAVAVSDTGGGTVTASIDGTTRTASGIRAVLISTGAGNDTIGYTLTGDQTGPRLVSVNAGGGDDTVTLTAAAVNGLFTFAAFGGDGKDTLTSTSGGVGAAGGLAVTLDGGGGDDAIAATASGEMDGAFALGLYGGAGDDRIDGGVTVAAGSGGRVFVGVGGGFGDDTLSLSVVGGGLAGLQSGRFALDGGPGKDSATTSGNVMVFNVP